MQVRAIAAPALPPATPQAPRRGQTQQPARRRKAVCHPASDCPRLTNPWHAGIPSRPNVAARPLRNIAEYSVNALKTGTLNDLDILDK